MKYIIFSDIHSNLEAIEAFDRAVQFIEHDKKVCLGDIVGYNADPNFAVDWVRKEVDLALAGNHDCAVLKKTDTTYFNSAAKRACTWTQEVLTEINKKFLDTLPIQKTEDNIFWVHSSPFEPAKWHYVSTEANAVENFDYFSQDICFLGHSHLPRIFEKNEKGEVLSHEASRLELESKSRYIINVGSLGQPRDGNSDLAFVCYDSVGQVAEFYRFPYDFPVTQEKIRTCGLPSYLADRLSDGQ
ncbi:MAG: metallophosphoesterase family protein [Nitrospinaceae bacterium]|jgi:predicted phosphodiesterase|nr:metallophosphoesterase family protein [Nitrospinaceae bacterium]|tara:strand:+ start:2055 stop:2783 length:729 start_codon:yes stop_codon:yes gene_type:complete